MDDDKTRLYQLINDTVQDLGEVVVKLPLIAPRRHDIWEQANAAWAELMASHLPRLFDGLQEVPREKLDAVALTGKSLEFKLQECAYRRKKFRSLWNRFLSSTGLSRSWLRRSLRLRFGQYVEAADNIIDSLAEAIPGAHALAEFKDALCGVATKP